MRQILFKAKCAEEPYDWVEGYLNKCEREFIISNDDGLGVFIKPDTICQYTGLTDKNGNRIWENDVIQYIDEDLAVNGVVRFGRHEQIVMLELGFYVEWVSNEAECFKTDICYWAERRDIDVIGNIFDNPELLKGE